MVGQTSGTGGGGADLSLRRVISLQAVFHRALSNASFSLRRLASGTDDWLMMSLPAVFRLATVTWYSRMSVSRVWEQGNTHTGSRRKRKSVS